MPAKEDLYVLAPGESGDDSEGWVSPRPIGEAVVSTVAAETDLEADDVDDVETYVDIADVAALLDAEGDTETLSFDVEGHDVIVDASGHVRVDD